MPIYEYQCNSCGKQFEVMQKMSDNPLSECIYCSSKKVEKIMSQTSFALKGTGWHKTDYAPAPKSCPAAGGAKDTGSPACASCPSAN